MRLDAGITCSSRGSWVRGCGFAASLWRPLSALALLLGLGCATPGEGTPAEASSAASRPQPVNRICPILQYDDAKPLYTVEFEGQRVGFCCANCIPTWEKKSAEERRFLLAEVLAMAKGR
jgi:hypothetical protein